MISKEQLDKVWDDRGLKFRFKRFHKFLGERGLLEFVTEELLLNNLYDVMNDFFVKDMKEDKDGRTFLACTGRTESDGES